MCYFAKRQDLVWVQPLWETVQYTDQHKKAQFQQLFTFCLEKIRVIYLLRMRVQLVHIQKVDLIVVQIFNLKKIICH